MNPPYSDVATFMARARECTETNPLLEVVVSLIPADVATAVWPNQILPVATEIRFLTGRLRYWDQGKPGKYTARFSSALVI